MARRSSLRAGLSIALFLLVFLPPAVVAAQPATSARRISPFVHVNTGFAQPSGTTFSNVATASAGPERAEFRADYRIKSGPIFDIGGGVPLGPSLSVAVSVSRYADKQPGRVALTLPHPIFRAQPLTARQDSHPLKRSESGVHMQFGYAVPLTEAFNVTFFGGPSYFRAEQNLVADLDIDQSLSRRTGAYSFEVSDLQFEEMNGSAWGFNVGADVTYYIYKSIGVGGLVRYGRATINLPNPVLSTMRDRIVTENVDVGGLQVMGGLRLRF